MNVALVCLSGNSRSALQDAITNAGHTYVDVAEGDLGTHDFSPYEALVVGLTTQASFSTFGPQIRSLHDAGLPLLLSMADSSTGDQVTAQGIPTQIGFVNASPTARLDQAQFSASANIEIIDNSHPITTGLSTGLLQVNTGNIRQKAPRDESSTGWIGATASKLADAQGSGFSGPNLTNKAGLVAVEAGALDVLSNPIGARLVLFSWCWAASAAYHANGKTLIANALSWLVAGAPNVEITTPADGAEFEEGATVTLTATATDTEDGDISEDIEWSSDIDGPLGTGASIETANLSIGTHQITASATDSDTLVGADSIEITITAAGVDASLPAPDVTIVAEHPELLAVTTLSTRPSAALGLQWRVTVDGEGVLPIVSVLIDPDDLTEPWRDYQFDLTQGAEGEVELRWTSLTGVGEWSDPVAFDLPDEDTDDDAPAGGDLGTVGEIQWEGQLTHPYPTARVPVTVTEPSEIGAGNPIRLYLTLKQGATVLATGGRYPYVGGDVTINADFLDGLAPGEYELEGHVLYTSGGYRRTPVRSVTIVVPEVLAPLRFRQPEGARLSGAAAEIEAVMPAGVLAEGTDRYEYTRDGSTYTAWLSGQTQTIESGEEIGRPTLNTTALDDGEIAFRTRRESEYEGDSDWRYSPWYVIDNEEVAHDGYGDDLTLDDFDIIGTTGAAALVDETVDEDGIPIFRITGDDNATVFLVLKEAIIGQPRSFFGVVRGRHSSSDGTGNSFQFVPDMFNAFGVGAFAGTNYRALMVMLDGQFGATGTVSGQGEGVMSFSQWASSLRLGRGSGHLEIRSGTGTAAGFNLAEFAQVAQWVRNWRYPKPTYQIGIKVDQTRNVDGTSNYAVRSFQNGPDAEESAGAVGLRTFSGVSIPCGGVCIPITLGSDGIVDIYGLTVYPLDYGDCEVSEFPSRPCSLELTVYETDRETIAWQAVTDNTWLGESGEAVPYLMEPRHYGEQEVDFARGTAKIAQVSVGIIDFVQTLGDQDSGWMTERLADDLMRTAIMGRRGRLRRFVSPELGWVVIADGPCGAPRMHSSYAAYEWEIRDTREHERRLRAFMGSGPLSVYPPGLYEANWGDLGGGSYLLEAVSPQVGAFSGNVDTSAGEFHFSGSIPYTLPMKQASQVVFTNDDQTEGYFPNVVILWRYVGDGDDDWRELRNMPYSFLKMGEPWLFLTTASTASTIGDDVVVIRLNFDGSVPHEEPDDASDLEVFVLYSGPSNEAYPFYVDEITAGQFLINLYDGLYSPRDADTGEVVSTGIRYDEDALLEMTTPIRLRVTEPIKDIRDWTEKNVYAPLGYAPALDSDGRISPVSQVIPTDPEELAALTVIDALIARSEPSWGHGDTVVNVLSLTYSRVWPDPESTAIDGLSVDTIVREFRNEESIAQNGPQELELESAVLVALGDENQEPLEAPEQGETAAFARRDNLFDRLKFGTPDFQLDVMRDFTYHLRAGDFVRVSISWFPEYSTHRRSMDILAQIRAIADLNCAWRRFTFQSCGTWTGGDYYDS